MKREKIFSVLKAEMNYLLLNQRFPCQMCDHRLKWEAMSVWLRFPEKSPSRVPGLVTLSAFLWEISSHPRVSANQTVGSLHQFRAETWSRGTNPPPRVTWPLWKATSKNYPHGVNSSEITFKKLFIIHNLIGWLSQSNESYPRDEFILTSVPMNSSSLHICSVKTVARSAGL